MCTEPDPVFRATKLLLLAFGCLASAGCGRVVFTPVQNPIAATPQQQQALAQQSQQWQQRANGLDRDNQELGTLVAQQRQQITLLNDEVRATREQLRTVSGQLEESVATNKQLRRQTETLTASMQRRRGAQIRPNNSLIQDLELSHVPGVIVRPDGDVIRIEVPTSKLFQEQTAHFRQGATVVLRNVGVELGRKYPNQIIGIEAHTDREMVRSSSYASNHLLTIAQATAVYEYLTRNANIRPEQTFVTGHGANHPVVSNALPAGRARNRRVELVVYPEQAPR